MGRSPGVHPMGLIPIDAPQWSLSLLLCPCCLYPRRIQFFLLLTYHPSLGDICKGLHCPSALLRSVGKVLLGHSGVKVMACNLSAIVALEGVCSEVLGGWCGWW